MSRPLTGAVLIMAAASVARGDLMGYLAQPDASYGWNLIDKGTLSGGVGYVQLVMTSQTWRDITWKHHLTLILPTGLKKASHALLIISGGDWREGDEKRQIDKRHRELDYARQIAQATGAPVALLHHVPFQPIFDGKHEDAIISYTFQQYMKSSEEDWPLLMPMVKAAVRAMDTVQEYARKELKLEVPRFVLTGASKRGWTTYLTSAVDPRVDALAPMVFDTLSMAAQMKHQLDTWGKYSEQISDYTEANLPDHLDTEPGRKLVSLVDPFVYRGKLTQPKLILLGTNDRYWPLDALNLYWPGLEGEKYVLYVPNAGHGLNDARRVISGISALVLRAAGKLTFPRPVWDLKESDAGLDLEMRSNVPPVSVAVWTAAAPTRDFRDARWSSSKAEPSGGAFTYRLTRPAKGFAAAFGEFVYEIDGHPLHLSTNVRIIQAKP